MASAARCGTSRAPCRCRPRPSRRPCARSCWSTSVTVRGGSRSTPATPSRLSSRRSGKPWSRSSTPIPPSWCWSSGPTPSSIPCASPPGSRVVTATRHPSRRRRCSRSILAPCGSTGSPTSASARASRCSAWRRTPRRSSPRRSGATRAGSPPELGRRAVDHVVAEFAALLERVGPDGTRMVGRRASRWGAGGGGGAPGGGGRRAADRSTAGPARRRRPRRGLPALRPRGHRRRHGRRGRSRGRPSPGGHPRDAPLRGGRRAAASPAPDRGAARSRSTSSWIRSTGACSTAAASARSGTRVIGLWALDGTAAGGRPGRPRHGGARSVGRERRPPVDPPGRAAGSPTPRRDARDRRGLRRGVHDEAGVPLPDRRGAPPAARPGAVHPAERRPGRASSTSPADASTSTSRGARR